MPIHVDVTARGEVPAEAITQARAKVGALDSVVNGPILAARVVLIQQRNPRLVHPSRAEGEIVFAGRPIRGRVAAENMVAAVDALAEHLQRRLRQFVDRVTEAPRRAPRPPGEWFHGAWSPPRPDFFDRPPDEREIVRRKSFTMGAATLAEAAADLAALDHDFLLFRHADAGADAVLHRDDGGGLELIVPPQAVAAADTGDVAVRASRFSEAVTLADARSEMDAVDHRFLFFVDAGSGRGNVIYRRYDGHYGVIEPAA